MFTVLNFVRLMPTRVIVAANRLYSEHGFRPPAVAMS